MFCIKCGNQIRDGYKFCSKCGTPVYVGKERPNGEVLKDDVAKEEQTSNETEEKSAEEVKNTIMPGKVSISKEKEPVSSSQKTIILNPLIVEELDIEGVKKMAEQGNKVAMLRQAFRYEIGIGCIMDKGKADQLYKQIETIKGLLPIEELNNKEIVGTN